MWLEGAFRRRGSVLAVYASTGANNLWRLCSYNAVLLSAAQAPGAGAAALRGVAWAGVAVSVAILLIFEPLVARLVPVALPGGAQAGAER
jgi:hypothetical protein